MKDKTIVIDYLSKKVREDALFPDFVQEISSMVNEYLSFDNRIELLIFLEAKDLSAYKHVVFLSHGHGKYLLISNDTSQESITYEELVIVLNTTKGKDIILNFIAVPNSYDADRIFMGVNSDVFSEVWLNGDINTPIKDAFDIIKVGFDDFVLKNKKKYFKSKVRLRKELQSKLLPKDLKAMNNEYKTVLDAGMMLIYESRNIREKTIEERDAGVLFQMTFTRAMAVHNLANGLNYTCENGNKFKLNNFVDPTAMDSIIRSQFESFCTFNNIYCQRNSKEQREFLYMLWVCSGLKYRQRFIKPDMLPEHKKKSENERKEIDLLIRKIENSSVFSTLSEKKQREIRTAIKDYKFQYAFKNESIYKCSWQEMFSNAGDNTVSFNNIYSSLSLRSHPSNVSVFQYNDMYQNNFQLEMASTTLNTSRIILAMMIHDYCKLHVEILEAFKRLPELVRLQINFLNNAYRGSNYLITEEKI